jgi:hypothetical protein
MIEEVVSGSSGAERGTAFGGALPPLPGAISSLLLDAAPSASVGAAPSGLETCDHLGTFGDGATMSDLFYRGRVSNADTDDCQDVPGHKSCFDALDVHLIASRDYSKPTFKSNSEKIGP